MIKTGEYLVFHTEGKRMKCKVERIARDDSFFSVVEMANTLHIGKPISMSITRHNGIESGEGVVVKIRPYVKEPAKDATGGVPDSAPAADSGLIEYLIKITTPFKNVQKRKHFRYDCYVPATLSEFNDPELYESHIMDISAGGAKIFCNHCFRINKVINIITSLENRSLHLLGIVLGVDNTHSSSKSYQFIVRVKFTDMSQAEEDAITRFIFSQYRKVAHKKTEKH